ncbi:SRPBCC family protein [Streptomyces cavernae]|uniref:SRPBCC family protein n=1 Tax=Streptomyces cavernae TaxID=2259034 RepID=UPI000FEB9227|nr:SRPBCC family protein [Streptomyces cavernae]
MDWKRSKHRNDWSHYRFRSQWALPVPPAVAYAVLARAEDYPRWWRQVREVTRIDDRTGTLRIRSVLPYDLVLTAREELRDPVAGILGIAMTGDLEGWARWTLTAADGGTRAVYDQEVDVTKPLLKRLAVPGRPLFRANHTLMMRAGRRGLLAHLAATNQAV